MTFANPFHPEKRTIQDRNSAKQLRPPSGIRKDITTTFKQNAGASRTTYYITNDVIGSPQMLQVRNGFSEHIRQAKYTSHLSR